MWIMVREHYPGDTSKKLRWSSGYDARLTRERSPVQSRDEVVLFLPSNLLPLFVHFNVHTDKKLPSNKMHKCPM